jgi:hypothetical protein
MSENKNVFNNKSQTINNPDQEVFYKKLNEKIDSLHTIDKHLDKIIESILQTNDPDNIDNLETNSFNELILQIKLEYNKIKCEIDKQMSYFSQASGGDGTSVGSSVAPLLATWDDIRGVGNLMDDSVRRPIPAGSLGQQVFSSNTSTNNNFENLINDIKNKYLTLELSIDEKIKKIINFSLELNLNKNDLIEKIKIGIQENSLKLDFLKNHLLEKCQNHDEEIDKIYMLIYEIDTKNNGLFDIQVKSDQTYTSKLEFNEYKIKINNSLKQISEIVQSNQNKLVKF